MSFKVVSNRNEGAAFEEIFKRRAQSNWLYAKKNELQARRIKGGIVKTLKSDLDFKLISRDGKVGYFDCKCFVEDFFVFSDINDKQLDLAASYNDWNVPSGFVVFFKSSDLVVFYTGRYILNSGSGRRFLPSQGLILGSLQTFDLRPVLRPHGGILPLPRTIQPER